MESTADYKDGLLRKITDNTEASVSYDYDSMRRLVRVTDATGNKISTRYDSIWDRAVSSYQSGVISVANTYADTTYDVRKCGTTRMAKREWSSMISNG